MTACSNTHSSLVQREFEDPKTEVLYHIKPDLGAIIPLHGPQVNNMLGLGASNKSVPVAWPLIGINFSCAAWDFFRGSKLLGFAKHLRVRDHRAPFKARLTRVSGGQRCSSQCVGIQLVVIPKKDREVQSH